MSKANPNIFLTTVAYPIDYAPFFEKVLDRALLTKEWGSATDRDYVIAGRHSRTYYKHADRWLRSEVAAFRAEATDPAQATLLRADAEQARSALLATTNEVEA